MKKAILVVSFGSTIDETRANNIDPVVSKIKKIYGDYDVYQAFTSRIVIKRLKERGIEYLNELEMIQLLIDNGYKEIYIQSLHLIGGEEFNKLRNNIKEFIKNYDDVNLSFGRPLLFYMGQEDEYPDDYKILLELLVQETAKHGQDGILFVGHGGISPENNAYATLQLKALQYGYKNIRFSTIECYPTLDDVLSEWSRANLPKKLHIYPLMLVAGDHVVNDIMGDEEVSYVNVLRREGYEVEAYKIGLGMREAVQDIYIEHLNDAIHGNNQYKNFFNNKE